MNPGFIFGLVWLVLLQACAELPADGHADSAASTAVHCSAALRNFEFMAEDSGVWLSEPRAVPEFPALASNRFLASFDPAQLGPEQREDWLQRLLSAGAQRRERLAIMLASRESSPLPDAVARLPGLDACARQQVAALTRSPSNWQRLAAALSVADDYLLSRRILGLYPLVSLGVNAGIEQLQDEMQQTFAMPLADLAVRGELHAFAPQETEPAAMRAQAERRDSLGLQVPGAAALTALLQRHAPIWEIDVAGDFDRPGRPYFAAKSSPRVDSSQAVVYQYASLTRFAGATRLQLNYLIWFDGRPAENAFDSLSGALDGLQWRVTLNADGDVLVYDSVHACGCYQAFFPTSLVRQRETSRELAEPPLIAQRLPLTGDAQRPVLRVSSAEHYVQRVRLVDPQANSQAGVNSSLSASNTQSYQTLPYEALYTVAGPEGVTSLFGREGIVPGTQRGERFYLWPMGVRSPGAMRERGRHATAFLGRRHFDDAHLLDVVFELNGR